MMNDDVWRILQVGVELEADEEEWKEKGSTCGDVHFHSWGKVSQVNGRDGWKIDSNGWKFWNRLPQVLKYDEQSLSKIYAPAHNVNERYCSNELAYETWPWDVPSVVSTWKLINFEPLNYKLKSSHSISTLRVASHPKKLHLPHYHSVTSTFKFLSRLYICSAAFYYLVLSLYDSAFIFPGLSSTAKSKKTKNFLRLKSFLVQIEKSEKQIL